jgi:hexosaminidase
MPGHTTAWLVAYPMLASAPGPYKIERSWGVFVPCMDPTRKRVYSFLDSFIGEMAGLFPDEYFHIGGDEVNGKQWNTRSRIRAFKKREHLKDNRELQAYFNQNLLKILGKHGKKMIGWDEIFQPNLPKNIAIQSWRGQASLAESAHQRYAGILSYGYYLDRMQPASFHYAADPLAKEAESLSADEKARILGGEACMWGEFVDPDNIYSRIWPRTAAIAERLWSPAEAKDVRDMYRRLEYVNRDLDSLGLNYRAGYQEKLQQMVGDQSAAPLKALADLLRPAALGVRQRTRRYTSTTPLNRLVDIINPESDAARQFADLVEEALENRSGLSAEFREMRKQMTIWQENDAGLKPMLEQSILLKEIIPLSAAISGLSKAGIEALDYLASGQKPPDAWRNETAAILEQAEKPQAEILPAIAPPIRRLVEAAMAIQ